MRIRFAVLMLSALFVCSGLFAQGEPSSAASAEDEFFGSVEVEAKQGAAEKKNIEEEVDKERVGLSGIMQGASSFTMTREYALGQRGIEDNALSNVMSGDFLVDVRLKKSFRAYLDLSLGYLANGVSVTHSFTNILTTYQGVPVAALPPGASLLLSEPQTTLFGLKEMFVDFNAANTAYFRLGKQVLQWGRGYFWNPTDLINIERKSFMSMDALREGVFGLRSDVTFAREFHLYTFLDFNGIADISDTAFSARAEFLAGRTEFGFSGWFKKDRIPIYGVDLSTLLFWELNLTGEASFSWGDNRDVMNSSGMASPLHDQLVSKVDIGLSRSFDAWDVLDRIMVNAEFFYNSSGYEENMFEKLPTPALATFFGNYYQAGYYGKYYGAVFVSISQFGLHDMTLVLSGLCNFSDLSGIAMANLSYSPVNNFTLSLQVGSYLGADRREYTIAYNPSTGSIGNNLMVAALTAKVAF
jgi:hypothetical protein